MRVFSFSKVIYDGYLTVDLVLFIIRQKFTRIFDFFDLIPSLIKFFLKRIDTTTLIEEFYNIILKSITISELNLFKVQNIHKVDLSGFGIVKDNPNDVIVTGEPSFLLDLFINRNKYNVICTDFDLRTRKIVGKLCLNKHKIEKLNKKGINSIKQLFIYSFKEKELMNMSEFIFVYRDHQVIEYDSYQGRLKDKLFYNITNRNLITFVAVAIMWFLIMIILSSVATLFMNKIAAFALGYLIWVVGSFVSMSMLNTGGDIEVLKMPKYILGVLPNFLLQLLLVIVFGQIIGLLAGLVLLVGCVIAFPLLVFVVRFYNFD